MFLKQEKLTLIKKNIISVPNYPRPGLLFRDITNLVKHPYAYAASISLLADYYRKYNLNKIVGIEARGFLFGAPLALSLGLGFIPVRKPGKLPRATISENYVLEYGNNKLEIHRDSIIPGDRILIVDDLLATGGTICAVAKLIRRLNGVVDNAAFIINLVKLGGENILSNIGIKSYSLLLFNN
ncbi:MAG: adenine phosphoribosyltransferase, partial [Candidatus Lightella neohaematopini]|nr:adenine phosphoribosyltransferase [Candidatus Lightella neohaematopini]MCV2531456.1 adenine phosphoribosyltransferase [Candidatus Lightella neohaematopini]